MSLLKLIIILAIFPFQLISQTNTVKIGNTAINIVSNFNVTDKSVVFLNIHENEQSSIRTINALDSNLNHFYLHHQGTRRIFLSINGKKYSIDPNRIFTEMGRKKTIKPWWRFRKKDAIIEVEKLANFIIEIIKPYSIVVALHNNTEENYSIESYLPGGNESKNTTDIHISKSWDADDFVYTTHLLFFNYLKSKDINVILQDDKTFVDDGSLSVYCAIKGIPYINIEAQQGHYDQQYRLTRIVKQMILEN